MVLFYHIRLTYDYSDLYTFEGMCWDGGELGESFWFYKIRLGIEVQNSFKIIFLVYKYFKDTREFSVLVLKIVLRTWLNTLCFSFLLVSNKNSRFHYLPVTFSVEIETAQRVFPNFFLTVQLLVIRKSHVPLSSSRLPSGVVQKETTIIYFFQRFPVSPQNWRLLFYCRCCIYVCYIKFMSDRITYYVRRRNFCRSLRVWSRRPPCVHVQLVFISITCCYRTVWSSSSSLDFFFNKKKKKKTKHKTK